MLKLRGATALVTGASKGLGAAFAHALAARGVNLVLVARSQAGLEALAKELEYEYPVRVTVLSADLVQAGEAERVTREIEQRAIKIDLLINNAGYGLSGSFVHNPPEQELGQVSLNVQALMTLTHFFGAQMSRRGEGGIINIASNASFQPVPYQATYAATKAFVLSFTEAVGYELGLQGVQVMASCPGPTATSFFDTMQTSMQMGQMDSSESVAVNTLAAFERGERIAYPGRTSVRLLAVVAQLFPRAAVLKLAAAASKKMGLHLRRAS